MIAVVYPQAWQNGSAREVVRQLQHRRLLLQQRQQQRPQLLSLEVHRQHRLLQQLPQPQPQPRLRQRLRERLLRHQQGPRRNLVVARLVQDARRQPRVRRVRPKAAYSSSVESAICKLGAASRARRLPHGPVRRQGLVSSVHSRRFAARHAEAPRRRVRSARLGRL